MNPTSADRDTFLQNLRASKLLTSEQFRQVMESVRKIRGTKELVKHVVNAKYITKFQAKMLLRGNNAGYFLGPYRVLDQLGKGGMGHVYKALHERMNRVVALKVLSPRVVDNEKARELFAHEAQAAAQLNHPNIVITYDADERDGRHFIAMEFVDGPNLEKYVKDRGPLPIGLACEIVFQTANGLQHALDKGMVHRDIKPANLLLQQDANGPGVQVKILDFGLARLQKEQTVSKDNTVMGTPDFLSPEQSQNLRVDIRSDLYSLGCTFYFLLTGQVPFPGSNILEKIKRHNVETARPIEEIRSDVPPKIAAIVRKLMEKEPEARHQTPDELMDALAPYAAPMSAEWPIAPTRPLPAMEKSDELVMPEPQDDTEPRALASTEITDEESIMEWASQQSMERRFVRRAVVIGVLVGIGVIALGAAMATAWMMMQ